MSKSIRSRRRWPRRVVLLAGASLGAAAAFTRWERKQGGDPWDPSRPAHPEDEALTVTTHDGAELAITVAGPADGPTVVLSHCWMGRRGIWGPVAERLVESGHRVVLYDQRGHGLSGFGDHAPSIAMLGDDLRLVLETVDAQDAVLVGHSMGGMSVQSYAAEHPGDFKERARAVVLVATASMVTRRPLPPGAIDRLMGEGSRGWSRRGGVGYALARSAFGKAPRRTDVELTLDSLAQTSGAARAGFMSAMSTMDLRPVLGTIEVPVAVLVGTRDRLTPPRLARLLAEGISGARLTVLPGAGHMLPLEAPDEVADAIRTIA